MQNLPDLQSLKKNCCSGHKIGIEHLIFLTTEHNDDNSNKKNPVKFHNQFFRSSFLEFWRLNVKPFLFFFLIAQLVSLAVSAFRSAADSNFITEKYKKKMTLLKQRNPPSGVLRGETWMDYRFIFFILAL